MIEVRIFRTGQEILGFAVTGHSNFRPRGSDIVCSAISALSQTAVLGLEQVGASPDWNRKDGFLTCRLKPLDPETGRDAQVVLNTVLAGINNIARHYPQHVSVCYEEV